MAYDISGDLATALKDVTSRLNSRYYAHNRTSKDVLGEARISEDQKRVQMLKTLQSLAADPNRSAAINSGVDAQMGVARQNAADVSGMATGNMTMGAADAGLLGSSGTGRARGQIAQAQDQAVKAAATSADDWRQSVKDTDQNYIGSVLDQILAPSSASQGAMQAMSQGFQTNLGLNDQLSQVKQQQNQILAGSIGNFLGTTVAPGVGAAFQVAGAKRDASARGQPYQSAWQTLMSGG